MNLCNNNNNIDNNSMVNADVANSNMFYVQVKI